MVHFRLLFQLFLLSFHINIVFFDVFMALLMQILDACIYVFEGMFFKFH